MRKKRTKLTFSPWWETNRAFEIGSSDLRPPLEHEAARCFPCMKERERERERERGR